MKYFITLLVMLGLLMLPVSINADGSNNSNGDKHNTQDNSDGEKHDDKERKHKGKKHGHAE